MNASYQVGRGQVEIAQGSITRYRADALVCPANPYLNVMAEHGGIQAAFLLDGGLQIFNESQLIAEILSPPHELPVVVPTSSAHITSAGRLPAKCVIHVVAVCYAQGEFYSDETIIAESTKNALNLAKEKKLQSVGFPALVGFPLLGPKCNTPLEEAVESMIEEFVQHFKEETTIGRLGLVLSAPDQYLLSKEVLDKNFLRR